MQDAPKTQKELLQEFAVLRQWVGFLEATDVAHQQASAALEDQVRGRTAALHLTAYRARSCVAPASSGR